MDALDAMRHVISSSGKSVRTLGIDLGRAPTYLSGILTRGSVPTLGTAAAIARACGYDLQLVRRGGGETITIDAPERG